VPGNGWRKQRLSAKGARAFSHWQPEKRLEQAYITSVRKGVL